MIEIQAKGGGQKDVLHEEFKTLKENLTKSYCSRCKNDEINKLGPGINIPKTVYSVQSLGYSKAAMRMMTTVMQSKFLSVVPLVETFFLTTYYGLCFMFLVKYFFSQCCPNWTQACSHIIGYILGPIGSLFAIAPNIFLEWRKVSDMYTLVDS